jgi:D-arabinose 1-dehydrogenase-like Zn-dependent alcohol dehydrogenase
MRAAVLQSFGAPLEVTETPEPLLSDGQVLVGVRAVGLCATDLKIASGALAPNLVLPRILGHEIAGEVIDPGQTSLQPGQRVACHHSVVCGECPACREGRPQFCIDAKLLGLDVDGGLADRVAVPAVNVVPFADGTSFTAAAVTMDAVATTWHALHERGAVQEGETLVVVGAGGLGLNAIQVARDSGVRVAVVEPEVARRVAAVEAGAELAVAPDDAAELHSWSNGGADVSFEVSGTEAGFRTALAQLRSGGRVVCCGYFPGREFPLDSFALVGRELTVVGSRSSTLADAAAAMRAVDEERITPPVGATFALTEINEALAEVAAARAPGRIVIEL